MIPQQSGNQSRAEAGAARLARYCELRRSGESSSSAAALLVPPAAGRSGRRYEREYQQQGETP